MCVIKSITSIPRGGGRGETAQKQFVSIVLYGGCAAIMVCICRQRLLSAALACHFVGLDVSRQQVLFASSLAQPVCGQYANNRTSSCVFVLSSGSDAWPFVSAVCASLS